VPACRSPSPRELIPRVGGVYVNRVGGELGFPSSTRRWESLEGKTSTTPKSFGLRVGIDDHTVDGDVFGRAASRESL